MKSVSIKVASGLLGLSMLAVSVPAFADTTATSSTGIYNVACVQTAVGVHEDANISALTAYNTAVSAALVVRKNEMVGAWAQTSFTARISALKAAIEKYRASVKVARATYKTAHTTSNTAFETSMKNCGVVTADIKGQTKMEKREGKIGLNLGLGGNFGFHFGKGKGEGERKDD